MRFAVLVKASPQSEAGVLLAMDGLQPSSKGGRLNFSGGKASVTDGPFAETKELVAGFWLVAGKSQDKELVAGFWLVAGKSQDEVVERFRHAPFEDGQLEIRQIFEVEDFAADLPADVRERGEKVRAALR